MLVLARGQSLGRARASWTSRVSPQCARARPLRQTQQQQQQQAQRPRRLCAMAAMMDVDGAGGAGGGAEETPVASVADLVVGETAAAAQQQQDPQAAVEAVRALYSGPETVTTFGGVQGWTGAGRRQAWLEAAAKAGTGGADAKIPLEARVFDIGQFLAPGFCKTQVYGRSVLYGHVLKSTQTSIYEHGLAFPEGTLCVADVQTSGKGRGSNEWTSPPGCLLFSYISTVRDGRTLPLVQYLVCIAIVEAIKSLEGLEDAKVGIKWPNDIYYDKSTKIGGILCQSVSMGRTFKVCIGLGLNVDNEDPTTCLNAISKGPRVSREQVLARILERYEALHTEFEREGFNARLKSAYESAWLHSGQEVMLKDEGGRKVIIEGIAPDSGGCLVARDAFNSSMRFELYPDGNRFDFFQGLISKRM